MKFINKYKSPNYNSRKTSLIKFIIIHYTAIRTCEEAISHLCNPKNKVSCHFIVSQNGKIYSLVNENNRAWHAGVSQWNNQKDINSNSIGIELDYSRHQQNKTFSKKMIESLILLISYLIKKYKIEKKNVLGHSDVAPFRKKDPGPNFPWHLLSFKKLAFRIENNLKYKYFDFKKWFRIRGIKSNKKISIFILSYIGYDTFLVKDNQNLYKKLIKAYQSRFLPLNATGRLDEKTFNTIIMHFTNLVLTKF